MSDPAPATAAQGSSRPGKRRLLLWSLLGLLAVLIIAVGGFLIYASIIYPATAAPLAAVQSDPAIDYADEGSALVLTPSRPVADDPGARRGLVFIPGAKVQAEAYVATLAPLVDAGYTVVITRPILNFAIVEWRGLGEFTALAPEVESWTVGGHSLGGVRACQYAAEGEADALLLFGSYCAVDLSDAALPVLSIGGSEDGLSTPATIEANAGLLPPDARFEEVDGGNHAQFGSYGEQSGDGAATITEEKAHAEIAELVLAFLGASR